MSPAYEIRPAVPSDAPGIAAIYSQGIRDRIATFETRERAADEMVSRIQDARYPFLVAEMADEIAGWVAASEYRPRDCYAGVAEFSVYVAREHRGAGIGRALMEGFLPACADSGFWKLLSRVFPENRGSRALLAACGFREVGIYEKHAQLDGVWRDVVIVERLLPQNLDDLEVATADDAEVDAAIEDVLTRHAAAIGKLTS